MHGVLLQRGSGRGADEKAQPGEKSADKDVVGDVEKGVKTPGQTRVVVKQGESDGRARTRAGALAGPLCIQALCHDPVHGAARLRYWPAI